MARSCSRCAGKHLRNVPYARACGLGFHTSSAAARAIAPRTRGDLVAARPNDTQRRPRPPPPPARSGSRFIVDPCARET